MIFHIYADETNIGDLVSALGIKKSLGIRNTRNFVFKEYMEKYGDSWHSVMCDEIQKNAKLTDLIVIGGGGLFHACFENFWKEFLEREYKTETYLWGIGNCEIKDESTLLPRQLIEEIMIKTTILSVRDQRTAAWISHARSIKIIGCPSLSYFGNSRHFKSSRQITPTRMLYVKHEGLEKVFDKEITAHIEKIASDNNFELKMINNFIPSALYKNELLDNYSWADVIITSRLHGCIIGYAYAKKVIAISNDHKIDEFMLAINSHEYVYTPREFLDSDVFIQEIRNQIIDRKYLIQTIFQNKLIGLRIKRRYLALNLLYGIFSPAKCKF